MATAPTSFASPLIAALRGGIGDTGLASTVSLLPNIGPTYAPTSFVPFLRGGNINNVQAFAPMPHVPRAVQPEPAYIQPTPQDDLRPDIIDLQNPEPEPEPEPEVPDYTENLFPPIEPEPIATQPTPGEPASAISYPIRIPSFISEPLPRELVPSVEVTEVDVSETPAVQTDPVENFELDRELGIVQQSDVMEPVVAPAPLPSLPISSVLQEPVTTEPLAPSVDVVQSTDTNLEPVLTDPATALFELDRELGDIQQWDVMEPVATTPPALPEDFGYVEPASEPIAPEVVEPVPAFPEDFGYVEAAPETAPEPVAAQTTVAPVVEQAVQAEPSLDQLIQEILATEPVPPSYYDVATTEPVYEAPVAIPEVTQVGPQEVLEPSFVSPDLSADIESLLPPASESIAVQPENVTYVEPTSTLSPEVVEPLPNDVFWEEPVNVTEPSFTDQLTDQDLFEMALFDMLTQQLLTQSPGEVSDEETSFQ